MFCNSMSPEVFGFSMLWELSRKWEQFSDWTLLTLKRQNLRGLNLSFPFLSSKDKNFINCSTNLGSEKWSYIICSSCNRKKNKGLALRCLHLTVIPQSLQVPCFICILKERNVLLIHFPFHFVGNYHNL